MGREAAVMDWEQKFPFLRGLADWRRRKDDASVCAVGVLHGEGMAGADGDDDAYSEAGKCAVDCGK